MSSFTDDVRRRLGEDAAPSYGALVQGGQHARESAASTFRMGRDERILLYGLMVVCVVLAVVNPLLVDGCSGQGGLVGAARTLLTFPSAWSQSVVMGLGSVCIAGIALTARGLSRVSADQRTALTAARWGGIVAGAPTALVLAVMAVLVALTVTFLVWVRIAVLDE